MLKLTLFSLVVLSLIPVAFAQSTEIIDEYFANLNYFFGSETTVNAFFPLALIMAVIMFTSYALHNRTDPLSSVFSIGAVPLCIILSLMFISPITFNSEISMTTVEVIVDIENNTFTDNLQTTYDIPIIPNDQQFRFIFSSFFSLFAIFNGLLSVLIISGLKSGNR